jgi:hypothetical protein
MSQINRQISILRQRIIVLNRIHAVAISIATVCAILIMAGLIDFMVHWPMPGRIVIFIVGVIAALQSFRIWFKPLWSQAPTQTSVAIRVEEVEPTLRGVLASAVEFENEDVENKNPLAMEVIDRAATLWKTIQPNKHIRRSPAIYASAAAWITIGFWVAGFYFAQQTTKTALIRTLLPWSQTEWPPRLLIHSEIMVTHVAKGETFMLRVRADENQDPQKINGVRVNVSSETTELNGTISKKSFEMVSQSDGSWEKPIVAEGTSMSFLFYTDDTKTPNALVQVVDPPTIQSAQLLIQPPEYATRNREAIDIRWNGGTMPTLPAVLVGGTAKLEVHISVPLTPPQDASGNIDVDWLARTVVAVDTNTNMAVNTIQFEAVAPTQWNLTWPIDGGIDIVVDPSDENGIRGQQPLRTRIQIVMDQEPTVMVSDPEQDEVVTKNASIPILIEARDDLELESIGFRLDRQQRSGEPAPKTIQKFESSVQKSQGELKNKLQFNLLDVQNGDTLLLRGVAQDSFEKEGQKRRPTLSEPRRIRVVDQDVFEQAIRQQASTLRQNVARLEIGQKETINEKELNNIVQAQKSVTDRIDQSQKTIERLINRLDRNGLKELNISQALRDVGQQASSAASHSQNASQQLQQGATGKVEALGAAKKEQAESLKAIQAMLDILDQDDDAAGAQRRTEKVAQEIARQRKDLKEIAKKTAGRLSEELSTEEKNQLQEQAQKQRATAQEARALVEDLQDRADRNKKKDPLQAAALRNAAKEGERGDAAKKMEEAADRSEKNQSGAADDSMQSAAEAIEKVQKALKADQKAKNEELKRRLSSLVETIRGLIVHAETGRTEIDTVLEAPAQIQKTTMEKAEALARNTAATIEESRSAGRSTDEITKILERASELESAVVSALRSTPIQVGTAQDASSRGIELLKQALEKSEQAKQKQQAEESDKERDDLANKYRELARQEKVLRQEVSTILPPDEKELDRKSAAISREIAERQKTLRGQISNIVNQSDIVKDSAVFVKTHQLIDGWMGFTQDELSNSKPTPETVAQFDFTTEALEALAESLTDPEQKDDPFAQNNSENSGGGGGEGGAEEQKKKIPPIAEIRLVRELQGQINRRTKVIEDVGVNSPGAAKAMEDLSKLQNDVRLLGEEWVSKMKKAANPPATNKKTPPNNKNEPAIQGSVSRETLGAFVNTRTQKEVVQDATPTNQTPTKSPENSTTPPPKTLDELLGITGAGGEKAAQTQRKDNLERGLNEESLNDLAEAAMQDMKLAEKLVSQDHDTGIGTQRVQAQALSRLDALIDAAVKFEKSSSKKSSKNKSQKDKSNSKPESGSQKNPDGEKTGDDDSKKDGDKKSESNPGGEKNKESERNKNGESGDNVQPPDFMDAELQPDSALDEGRSEWGRLPQRIREIMSQSRRDRISALYQKATEAYYRRMAEDRGP